MAFCSLPGANWNARARRHRMTANTSRSAKHKKRFCLGIGRGIAGGGMRWGCGILWGPCPCSVQKFLLGPGPGPETEPENRHLFWILWLILSRWCLFAMAWYSLAYNIPIPIRLASTAQHCNRWGHYGVGGPKGRCCAEQAERECRFSDSRQKRVKPTRNQFSTIKESIYLTLLANCLSLNELSAGCGFQRGAGGAAPFKWGTNIYILYVLYVYWYVWAEHAYKSADDRHDNGEPNYWFSGQKSKSKANKPQMLLRILQRDSSDRNISRIYDPCRRSGKT